MRRLVKEFFRGLYSFPNQANLQDAVVFVGVLLQKPNFDCMYIITQLVDQ